MFISDSYQKFGILAYAANFARTFYDGELETEIAIYELLPEIIRLEKDFGREFKYF